ncbi:hypothetical protein Ade02nite_81480 [Paractinoplanes deccanensis]|uniref:NB-ARC domain-containing protein n=1 Tax=Paractinoplanes deccanensis TaxID=113561 RepID=A0ABQ3YHQ5_9ACTN|nr:NB-ARC domain-containing protein [Actinoplanes deccanensis]GID79507.1 hypothetical protein Ade02nite_81480 [Actinoplanes deccanensis]
MLAAVAVAAVAATVVSVAVNLATDTGRERVGFIERDPWWWVLGGTLLAVAAGAAVWWTQQRYAGERPRARRPRPVRPDWVVDRPGEVNRVVEALRGDRDTVSITTGVYGAGGFGKSTVAQLVRADRRVRRTFGDEVYWVTVGRDVRHGALAEKVTRLVAEIDPARAHPYPEVWRAAENLAAVLSDGPRRLVIVDDVWFPDQLDAFPAGTRSARLITTRSERLTEGLGTSVKVDQMSEAQARAVLTAGLPPMSPAAVDGLLARTGRWPLLLRLVNGILVEQVRAHGDVDRVAAEVATSAARVDELTGAAARQIDLSDPAQRSQAVTATLEASLGLLTAEERGRLAELAVFAEDETVPVGLVSRLWRRDAVEARALCSRLAHLALVMLKPAGIELHDVVRDYLRDELGPDRLRAAHRALAEAVPGEPWDLPPSERYLWEHLIEHLVAAGDREAAEELATDFRWVSTSLRAFGPLAPLRDLTAAGTPRCDDLARKFAQVAHLLTPTEPDYALDDILDDRLGPWFETWRVRRERPSLLSEWPLPDRPDPMVGRVLAGHRAHVGRITIAADGKTVVTWDLRGTTRCWDSETGRLRLSRSGRREITPAISPDCRRMVTAPALAAPLDGLALLVTDLMTGAERRLAFRRVSPVAQVAAYGPDGSWLATCHLDGKARIWDAGALEAGPALAFPVGTPTALGTFPGRRRIAVATADHAVRIYDAETGDRCAELARPLRDVVTKIVVAPDGERMATITARSSLRLWDPATGTPFDVQNHAAGSATAVAFAPDGERIATASRPGTVDLWDVATGRLRAVLRGHAAVVGAIAIAPDGAWLATGDLSGSVRTWDLSRAEPVPDFLATRPEALHAVALDGNGDRLFTVSRGGPARVWRADDGAACEAAERLARYPHAVATRGAWVARIDGKPIVRRIDNKRRRQRWTGPVSVTSEFLALAPDGTWLVTDGAPPRIWDVATGSPRVELTGRLTTVTALAIAADGTWLAAADDGGRLHLWDAPDGVPRATVQAGSERITALAIAPDSRCLAIGERGGVQVFRSDGVPVRRLRPIAGKVNALAFSPGSDRLAVIGDNGAVQIMEVHTGRPLAMTRVEQHGNDCVWHLTEPLLYVAGERGLYCFRYTHLP